MKYIHFLKLIRDKNIKHIGCHVVQICPTGAVRHVLWFDIQSYHAFCATRQDATSLHFNNVGLEVNVLAKNHQSFKSRQNPPDLLNKNVSFSKLPFITF